MKSELKKEMNKEENRKAMYRKYSYTNPDFAIFSGIIVVFLVSLVVKPYIFLNILVLWGIWFTIYEMYCFRRASEFKPIGKKGKKGNKRV
jgi:hypothetical protein